MSEKPGEFKKFIGILKEKQNEQREDILYFLHHLILEMMKIQRKDFKTVASVCTPPKN